MFHNIDNSIDTRTINPFEQTDRRPITPETIEWEPDLDTALAIDGRDIEGFREWINWNDADIDRTGVRVTRGYHQGLDLAAYLNTEGEIVLGLPPNAPVRAVADGRIDTIATEDAGYNGWIRIEHGKLGSAMDSIYRHVVAREGLKGHTEVKKGDIIGTLYIDEPREGNSGRLVHLHLEMLNGLETKVDVMMSKESEQLISPLDVIDSAVRKHTAMPQQSANFQVRGLEDAPIKIANFDNLLLSEPPPKIQ